MSSPKEDPLKSTLAGLTNRLPRREVRALIAELDGTRVKTARSRAVRKTLVEEYNRPRPHHARRLFTSLVEPLLEDDPVLLEAGGSDAVPGLVQRADVAGYWAGLVKTGFVDVANDVQVRLDALCASMVTEDALRMPEAQALRERMRARAVEVIDAIAKAPRKRDRFLAAVNTARAEDIAGKLAWPEQPPALSWTAVERFRFLLAENDTLLPLLEPLVHQLAGAPAASEPARAATALATAIASIQVAFRDNAARSLAVTYALAIALHRRGRYDLVAAVIRPRAGHATGVQLAEALCAHQRGAAQAIVRRLAAACRHADGGETISLDPAARGALDQLLDRYGVALDGTVEAGLFDSAATRFVVRQAHGMLQDAIDETVVPRLVARVRAAGMASDLPLPDHDDTVRLAGWLSRWADTVTRTGMAAATATIWRKALTDELYKACSAAIRLEPGADLIARMAHLARLQELVSSFGGDVAAWLTAIDFDTLAIVRRRLEDPAALFSAEAAIAERCLELVEAEVLRTRHWQISELVEFRDIGRGRFLKAPRMGIPEGAG